MVNGKDQTVISDNGIPTNDEKVKDIDDKDEVFV